MRAHRIMALLCAGILALSPAGGHLAYASETQGAQETSAAPETEVTELEEDGEDPAEGVSIPKETEDASTTAVTDRRTRKIHRIRRMKLKFRKEQLHPRKPTTPQATRTKSRPTKTKNPKTTAPTRIHLVPCFPWRRSRQPSSCQTFL